MLGHSLLAGGGEFVLGGAPDTVALKPTALCPNYTPGQPVAMCGPELATHTLFL